MVEGERVLGAVDSATFCVSVVVLVGEYGNGFALPSLVASRRVNANCWHSLRRTGSKCHLQQKSAVDGARVRGDVWTDCVGSCSAFCES